MYSEIVIAGKISHIHTIRFGSSSVAQTVAMTQPEVAGKLFWVMARERRRFDPRCCHVRPAGKDL